jgi:putative nucleotidyltransferase with HDIG domain
MLPNQTAAHELAARQLSGLPDRWAHTRAAARHAEEIAAVVGPADRELLICAAWLHDLGHGPELQRTGWHPLDGALYLAEHGWPERLAALVAHHSEARTMAQAHGLADRLAAFPREEGPIADALTYADMTSGPDGGRISLQSRLDDLERRHADEPAMVVAARKARRSSLWDAVDRTEHRLRGVRGSMMPA